MRYLDGYRVIPRWGSPVVMVEGMHSRVCACLGGYSANGLCVHASHRFCSNDMLYPPVAGSLFIVNMSVDKPKGLSMPFPSWAIISKIRKV